MAKRGRRPGWALWTAAVAAFMLVLAPGARSQQGPTAARRSTSQGVYTREQWMRGRDIYAGMCAGCHPAVTHVGPVFTALWAGKPLSELYNFIKVQMPKNDPGSLSLDSYVDVITYLLRLNGMPVGYDELPVDSVALSKIRIDSSRVGPPSPSPGR